MNPSGSHPYNTGLGTVGRGPAVYDSGDYPRCMEAAVDALDYAGVRPEQAQLRAEGRFLGTALVNDVEATGTAPLEATTVRVGPDGRVTVVTGASPQRPHPPGRGTFGRRTTALGGSATLLAARAVRDKAARIAAHLHAPR